MSNKLKNFIQDNRRAFDDEMPPGKIWDHIEASFSDVPKKRTTPGLMYKWTIAAAAMLVIASGIYYLAVKKDPVTPIAAIEKETGNLPPEYESQMNLFAGMIYTKQEELKILAGEQPELYRTFTTALNQLDSSYHTLKNQLGSTPNREMLLEAMIQNLQLQLNVLNQQLNIINQIKQSKKDNHEKIDQNI
jgi:LPS O-antigen subunit length determinant protein (WzzB/FepE family)